MSFADKIQKVADEAPEAGYGPNVSYGKLTTEVNVLEWAGEKGARKPFRTPYTEATELKDGQKIELTFNIDIKEYNPALEFDFKRTVVIEKSRADGSFKTDWTEIVEPSLIKVLGKDWVKKITDKKGIYVEVETPNSVKPANKEGKTYSTIRFTRVFKNSAECKAARDERFKSSETAEEGVGIPTAVVDAVKALYKSVGGKVEIIKPMLTSAEPYKNYDVDALLAEAGIEG